MKVWMLAALFILPFAFAGDKGGNGGGVHLCDDTVELYDFYEGRHPLLHGMRVWESDPTKTVRDYLAMALARLEEYPRLRSSLQLKVDDLLAIPEAQLIFPISIPRVMDSDIPFVDEDCEYAQVANWNERFDRLVFQRSIFDRLDSMNRAGLYMHEAIYKLAREINSELQDSDGVRPLVAILFSVEPVTFASISRVFGASGMFALADMNGKCTVQLDVISGGESSRLTGLYQARIEMRFPRPIRWHLLNFLGEGSDLLLLPGQPHQMECSVLAEANQISWAAYLTGAIPRETEMRLTINGAPVFNEVIGVGPYLRSSHPDVDRRMVFGYKGGRLRLDQFRSSFLNSSQR